MSKHVRVPAPLAKILPGIIRSSGAKVALLATGCAAILTLGGGHYLLSRFRSVPPVKQPVTHASAPSESKVLGSTTPEHVDTPATPTAQTTPAPAQPAQAVQVPVDSSPTTSGSFELTVDTSKIQLLGPVISVPFNVKRHGNLTGDITPGNVSITVGGVLSSLVTVQSEVMQTPDAGVLTLLPIGLGGSEMNVHFSASSGDAIASTSFTYKLKH